MKKLAEMYKEETGVTVEIESMGGGVDIQGTIKGYYQAGNMPDIFVNALGPEFKNWSGMLVDMSDEKWASDTDNAYVDEEEGTIGYPYTVEELDWLIIRTSLRRPRSTLQRLQIRRSLKKHSRLLILRKTSLDLRQW